MAENMATELEFNARAYCKMLLHCAKYPHCAVNGVLLAENDSSNRVKTLRFVDAIPLFHLCLNVSPMYEIALRQIEFFAASQGLVIAGHYMANENYRDVRPGIGKKIAEKIAENFPSACLVMIDNQNVSRESKENALITSQYSDGKWRLKDKSAVLVSSVAIERTGLLMDMRLHENIVDFDNHLDDVALDWTNSNLNNDIDEA